MLCARVMIMLCVCVDSMKGGCCAIVLVCVCVCVCVREREGRVACESEWLSNRKQNQVALSLSHG